MEWIIYFIDIVKSLSNSFFAVGVLGIIIATVLFVCIAENTTVEEYEMKCLRYSANFLCAGILCILLSCLIPSKQALATMYVVTKIQRTFNQLY